jgi:hypothetical protein
MIGTTGVYEVCGMKQLGRPGQRWDNIKVA